MQYITFYAVSCSVNGSHVLQVAARAQKRTVSDEEVQRYEIYNHAHGAKLLSNTESQEDVLMEDNW